jgi:uncharacterized protein
MNLSEVFKDKQYVNLDTVRKNGQSMKTPVWFVMDGDTMYVRTGADSGKVKRIRNNGNIQIAPCQMNGTPTGDWMPAFAREIHDEEISRKVDGWLGKKYGLMKFLFQISSKIQKLSESILEITERKD